MQMFAGFPRSPVPPRNGHNPLLPKKKKKGNHRSDQIIKRAFLKPQIPLTASHGILKASCTQSLNLGTKGSLVHVPTQSQDGLSLASIKGRGLIVCDKHKLLFPFSIMYCNNFQLCLENLGCRCFRNAYLLVDFVFCMQ